MARGAPAVLIICFIDTPPPQSRRWSCAGRSLLRATVEPLFDSLLNGNPYCTAKIYADKAYGHQKRNAEADPERYFVTYLLSEKISDADQNEIDKKERPQNLS